jgi:flagellar biosynthetic protein FliR
MPASLTFSTTLLFSFLLVLARVGGALVFVPLPGAGATPAPARVVLAVGFTLALASRWPIVAAPPSGLGVLLCWLAAEAALGLAIGVAVAIVIEAFALAAQVMGLQAGYAYASTIDPNTEADSGILLVFAQLMAGMLFFAVGLDRQVLRLFADTLERIPPGSFSPGAAQAQALIRLGANLFTFGLRLALPVVGLLILIDVALALLGRLHQQLQLLTLAFPVKMLTALLVLSWIAALIPRLMLQLAGVVWSALPRILGG